MAGNRLSFNSGYNRTSNLSLKRVNGVEVENLQHLHNLIKANTEKFIRFDLDENMYVKERRKVFFFKSFFPRTTPC